MMKFIDSKDAGTQAKGTLTSAVNKGEFILLRGCRREDGEQKGGKYHHMAFLLDC